MKTFEELFEIKSIKDSVATYTSDKVYKHLHVVSKIKTDNTNIINDARKVIDAVLEKNKTAKIAGELYQVTNRVEESYNDYVKSLVTLQSILDKVKL